MEYDYIYSLNQGVSIVIKDQKYGAVLSGGKLLIPPRYDYLSNFNNGRSLYCISGHSGIIDLSGNIVVEYNGTEIYFDSNIFDEIEKFSEDKAVFSRNNKYGVIDKEGNVIVEAIYDEILAFKDNVARVRKKNKWGLIDSKGSALSDIKYWGISNFRNNCALLYDERGFARGVINICGKEIIPYNDDVSVYNDNNSFTVYCYETHQHIYYDFKGNTVSNPNEIPGMQPHNWKYNYMIFHDNSGFGIKSKSGELILPTRFSEIYRFDDQYFEGELSPDFNEYELFDTIQHFSFLKDKDELWPHQPSWKSKFNYKGEQLLSIKGEDVIVPSRFYFAWPFCNGLAIVEKEGKWGVVDSTFESIIPLEYDYIHKCNSEFYVGIIDNQCYVYRRNVLVVSTEYVDFLPNNYFYAIQDNIGQIYNNQGTNILKDVKLDSIVDDSIFIISSANKLFVMDFDFNEILSLPGGIISKVNSINDYVLMTYRGNGCESVLMGIISSQGKLLVPFDYEHIYLSDSKITAWKTFGEIKELLICEDGVIEKDYSTEETETNTEDLPYEFVEFD